MSKKSVALAAPLLLTLSLAGCGAGGAPIAAPTASPLAEYLSVGWGAGLSPEKGERRALELHAHVEELVATCMAEEGFEYVPDGWGHATAGAEAVAESEPARPDDGEWVSRHGYGIADLLFGADGEARAEASAQSANGLYVESLPDSEQRAYHDALYGAMPMAGEATTPAPADEESAQEAFQSGNAGCYGRASRETLGEDPRMDTRFASLMEAVQRFERESKSAPAFEAVDRAWAACMDERGHADLRRQGDAEASIADVLYAAADGVEGGGKPSAAEVDELTASEIELAEADLACREGTNYRAEAEKIRYSLEAEFVADHRVELEEFKTVAEQSGKSR